jgi:hypothetical protein
MAFHKRVELSLSYPHAAALLKLASIADSTEAFMNEPTTLARRHSEEDGREAIALLRKAIEDATGKSSKESEGRL